MSLHSVDKRKMRQIERDMKRGVPPRHVTQDELDALHVAPCEENLAWWSAEREKAGDADDMPRFRMCDSARRMMLLRIVPHPRDMDFDGDNIIAHALEEFEKLPYMH